MDPVVKRVEGSRSALIPVGIAFAQIANLWALVASWGPSVPTESDHFLERVAFPIVALAFLAVLGLVVQLRFRDSRVHWVIAGACRAVQFVTLVASASLMVTLIGQLAARGS